MVRLRWHPIIQNRYSWINWRTIKNIFWRQWNYSRAERPLSWKLPTEYQHNLRTLFGWNCGLMLAEGDNTLHHNTSYVSRLHWCTNLGLVSATLLRGCGEISDFSWNMFITLYTLHRMGRWRSIAFQKPHLSNSSGKIPLTFSQIWLSPAENESIFFFTLCKTTLLLGVKVYRVFFYVRWNIPMFKCNLSSWLVSLLIHCSAVFGVCKSDVSMAPSLEYQNLW